MRQVCSMGVRAALEDAKMLQQAVRVRGLEGGMMMALALVAIDVQMPSISDAILASCPRKNWQ
jgi:hypothetical protein